MWTITYNGTEQSAAAWGLTAQPKIRTRDRSPTEFSFRMAGAPPEGTIPFPFKAQVVIRQNRTLSGGTWGGSGYVFTGYLTTQPGDVDGKGQGVTLVFKDAIWLMQNTTFQQLWVNASTPGNPDWVSRCVLFMDINSWAPNTYQSVQWQVNQIISYAASGHGLWLVDLQRLAQPHELRHQNSAELRTRWHHSRHRRYWRNRRERGRLWRQ